MNLMPSNNIPLISIITIVYNDNQNIQETIDSVMSQTYANMEYIIIDGGSVDGTKEILIKNSKFLSYFVSEPDKGIYDAINKGIAAATGKYIGLLHSGDLFFDRNTVQIIANDFNKNNTDSIFADVDIVNAANTNKTIRHYSGKNFNQWKLRIGLAPPHPTFYCKREVYKRLGKYLTKYRVSADYEMMVRAFYKYKISYSYINSTLVKMRDGGESNNGIFGQLQQNMEIIDAARRNNFYTNIALIAFKIPFRLIQYFLHK